MKLFFQMPSRDGNRSNSITAVFQQMSSKGKGRKKSAMSMLEKHDHEEYDIYDMMASGPPRKPKRRTVANFFRNLGSSRMSNRARYGASRIVSSVRLHWIEEDSAH